MSRRDTHLQSRANREMAALRARNREERNQRVRHAAALNPGMTYAELGLRFGMKGETVQEILVDSPIDATTVGESE